MFIDNRHLKNLTAHRQFASGFTLVEMVVVVAIVGILAAIAYPTYTEHIKKSRRTDAKTALLGVAAREEQIFSATNQYSKEPSKIGYGGTFPVEIYSNGTTYYQLIVTVNEMANKFDASATPIGSQATDKCGSFWINELGIQTNKDNSISSSECW